MTVRLLKLLVAKSVIDVLFLTVVVVCYAYASVPPSYRGWLDHADEQRVSGWATNVVSAEKVEVGLFIDGKFAGHASANRPRPDVSATLPGTSEFCGFEFSTPTLEAGEHEARVFGVASTKDGQPTFRQIGPVLRFGVSR